MIKIFSALIFLVGFSCRVLALTPEASFLSVDETEAVVHSIDTICGDTWCTGDLNYSFDQLVCNTNECYFDIHVITRNDSAVEQSRPHRCHLSGFQSASDLLETVTAPSGRVSHNHTDKLYYAMMECIGGEVSDRYPITYLPKSSACLGSLRKQPLVKSSAYSVYAQIFSEFEKKPKDSAGVLKQMVAQFANQDASCTLEYYIVFKDEVRCTQINGQREMCSFPTDKGHFLVITEEGATPTVIFIDE